MVAKEEKECVGKIYVSDTKLPASFDRWHSLGHFLEHKMRNDSANETILVSCSSFA